MAIDVVQLSRTMAYALRHHPEEFGLVLDVEGWVKVETLLQALRKRRAEWRDVQREDFVRVIERSEKKRYEMQGDKIRAYYGHSIGGKIVHEGSKPPRELYHGTTPKAYEAIRVEGLRPMGRQYVHLSEDEETARAVALRRTNRPVILRIAAWKAYERGQHFYVGNDNVWLVDAVAPEYIEQAEK
jgi:putative RNA 2'-phosphotransferase